MTASALGTELSTDPLRLGYAAFLPNSPGSVVEILNAYNRSIVKTQYMTARSILAALDDGAAILDKIQGASASNSTVKWAMQFMLSDGIDVGHPRTRALLDQLAATGVILQAEADEVKALALQPGSRAEELGLLPATETDVMAAWTGQ